nr:mas-related G-protein coupled receptor member X2 [Oryctolagus cuniculus]
MGDSTDWFLSTNSSVPTWETEMTTLNGSNETTAPTPDKQLPILRGLTFVIALLGLAGNAAVLWLLGFRIRKNAFSIYILNVAGADFLFLCCRVVVCLFDHFNLFNTSVSGFFPVWNFFYLVGLSILSAISTDRCLSVLWPVWYRCRRPRHLSSVLCALLWALSLVLSVLEGKHCGFLFGYWEKARCRNSDFFTAAWLVFLFLILSGSSLALLLRILCSSRKLPLTRLYVTVLLTVLIFLLCGLPYGIKWYLLFWIDSFNLPAHFHPVMVLLSCVNSSANPIIYFFVGSCRRWRQGQTLKQVLQRALQDTPGAGESRGSLSQGTLEM